MYSIIRSFLFRFDPEKIHEFTFEFIRILHKIPGMRSLLRSLYTTQDSRLKRTVFGIDFPNPVGLAAGFDKNAALYDELSSFGFGFVEMSSAEDGNKAISELDGSDFEGRQLKVNEAKPREDRGGFGGGGGGRRGGGGGGGYGGGGGGGRRDFDGGRNRW